MMDNVLQSIKKLLGITEDYEHFDEDILVHINTAINILTDIGVKFKSGFSLVSKDTTWSDYLSDTEYIDSIKNYIYLKTKLIFDPPNSSIVAEAIKRNLDELEWRISNNFDR